MNLSAGKCEEATGAVLDLVGENQELVERLAILAASGGSRADVANAIRDEFKRAFDKSTGILRRTVPNSARGQAKWRSRWFIFEQKVDWSLIANCVFVGIAD
jgi:hypothetical protein